MRPASRARFSHFLPQSEADGQGRQAKAEEAARRCEAELANARARATQLEGAIKAKVGTEMVSISPLAFPARCLSSS